MKMSRFLILAATAGILAVQTIGVARAVPVTIDFSLIPSGAGVGTAPGSGSLTVAGPISSVGMQTFGTNNNSLIALNFSIDGNDFSLADATNPGSVFVIFNDGQLFDFDYLGVQNAGALSVQVTAYSWDDLVDGDSSAGAVVTPLASAWLMMLTGLAVLGLFAHRRKQVSSGGELLA